MVCVTQECTARHSCASVLKDTGCRARALLGHQLHHASLCFTPSSRTYRSCAHASTQDSINSYMTCWSCLAVLKTAQYAVWLALHVSCMHTLTHAENMVCTPSLHVIQQQMIDSSPQAAYFPSCSDQMPTAVVKDSSALWALACIAAACWLCCTACKELSPSPMAHVHNVHAQALPGSALSTAYDLA